MIRLVGDEPVRTYERPPLSKSVLAGEAEAADAMWSPAATGALEVDWLLGERATGLDVGARTVTLAGGDELSYDGLVIATGASPRRLAHQPDLAGVHLLRSLDDCLGLRSDLDAGADRVVVVGAGFIGAEVAATCRDRSLPVTMVDPLEQPLSGVLGTEIGGHVAARHREAGVDLRMGIGVEKFVGEGRVEGVVLSDGSIVAADVVVVGIGVEPNTGWLEGSGLELDDGVVCDETCLAAPNITAAGDVARWKHPTYGSTRVEHWDNAVDMGRAAGRRLLDDDDEAEPYDSVPWFWSDQYDVKLQLAGVASPRAEVRIVEGDPADNKFVALYGRDGEVVAALGWNWPAKVVKYKMALEAGPVDWHDATS